MKPQLDAVATPPSRGRQGRQAGGVAMPPVGFVGLGPSGYYEYAQSERRRIAGGWQAGRGEAAEGENIAECSGTGRSSRVGRRAPGGTCSVR